MERGTISAHCTKLSQHGGGINNQFHVMRALGGGKGWVGEEGGLIHK